MTSTLHTPILMTVPIGYGVGSHVVSHALYESLINAGEAVVLLSPFVHGGLCEEGVDTA